MSLLCTDFGLSNEEFVKDAESGEEQHCRTQCGSPAYAAPELLGQKEYDKSVDMWSMWAATHSLTDQSYINTLANMPLSLLDAVVSTCMPC